MDLLNLPEGKLIKPVNALDISALMLLDELTNQRFSKVSQTSDKHKKRTFSSLSISSLSSGGPGTLLGVLLSRAPSASLPGHKWSLCLPLLMVALFLLKSLKVAPPTGTAEVAAGGPRESKTVKVICAFRGRSRYLIGSVMDWFHVKVSCLPSLGREEVAVDDVLATGLGFLWAVWKGTVKGLLSLHSCSLTIRSEGEEGG